MCITEYNEKETLQAIGDERFAEGIAEGKAKGKAEGRAEGKAEDIDRIKQMVLDGIITEEVSDAIIKKLSDDN